MRQRRERRCRKCGSSLVWGNMRVCQRCLNKWMEKRLGAFQQAKTELGELCSSNLGAIQKRVKEIELEVKNEG